MKVEIISYNKFKNTMRYKKYTHDIVANMYYLGFNKIGQYSLKSHEKTIDVVHRMLQTKKIISGKIVWCRKRDGWGCPFLIIFYNDEI